MHVSLIIPTVRKNGAVVVSSPPISWSWWFGENEGHDFVASLATALDYEISGYKRHPNSYSVVNAKPGGKFEIIFYKHKTGPYTSALVSRRGVMRVFQAMAHVLDWEITG